MKKMTYSLLSLAAPLLIFEAILGIFQRDGSDRLQALPAVCVGAGLIVSGALGRRRRRRKLLIAIRKENNPND